jgi:hypothetical protein
MDSRLINWRRVPWSLWAFAGTLLIGVVIIEATASAPVRPLVLAPFVVLAWSYFLFRGSRWLWFGTLAIYVLTIPGIVLGSVHWEAAVLTLVGLILLLLPDTREYFGGRSQKRSS